MQLSCNLIVKISSKEFLSRKMALPFASPIAIKFLFPLNDTAHKHELETMIFLTHLLLLISHSISEQSADIDHTL